MAAVPAGPGADLTAAGPPTASSQSSSDSGSSSSASSKFISAPPWPSQPESEATVPTSLLNFIFAEQQANTCSLDLAELINAIQAAIKAVNADLRFGGLSGNRRKAQDKAETILTNIIHASNPACMLLTPNRQIPITSDTDKRGKYAVCLQPLEGAFGGTHTPLFAGTVFGIHKVGEGRSLKGGKVSLRSPLLPGRHLVAAGYALYGITTTLVLSLGRKSNVFVLDFATGEFMLNNQPLSVPLKGNVYNVDEGHIYEWNPSIIEYIESKKDAKHGKTHHSQHFGCVVADLHSILLQGGICMLPKIRSQPAPQFSVLLCLAPLAYIACAAGGLASNGEVAILDICPESVTQTTAAFIGSRDDIRELLSCLRRRRSNTCAAKAQDVRGDVPPASAANVSFKHESTRPNSDSPSRNHIWRPAMETHKELAAPIGRSHLTIAPMSSNGSAIGNKIRQTSALMGAAEKSNALLPVAPLATVKNDHIRLTWPAFGSIVPNPSQQSTRKL